MVRRRGAGRGQWTTGRRQGPIRGRRAGPGSPSLSLLGRQGGTRVARPRLPRAGRSRPFLPPSAPAPLLLRSRSAPAPLPHWKEPAAAASRTDTRLSIAAWRPATSARLNGRVWDLPITPARSECAKLFYWARILLRTGDIQEQPGCNPVPCALG